MTARLAAMGDALPAVLLAVLPILFIPGLSDLFILPRAGLVVTGAALAAGCALVCGARNSLGPLRWPAVGVALAALAAFAFSASWPLSLMGAYTRYESLPVRLAYLGLFGGAAWLVVRPAWRRTAASAFIAAVSLAGLEAGWQQLSGFSGRPDGNLGNAGLLGALCAMALVLAAGRVRSGTGWLWGLAGLPLSLGLALSTSRSAWLGALAGLGALLALRLRGLWAAAASAALPLVLAAAFLGLLLTPLRQLNADPGPTRLFLWPDALRLVATRPLAGFGEDTLGLVFGRFLSGDYSPGVIFDRAHSAPLDLAAAQGLLGLLAAAWFWSVWWVGVWRQRAVEEVAALGGAWIACAVWALLNFDWAPVTGPLWLLAGLAWSAVRAGAAGAPAPALSPGLSWRPLAAAGLVLVGSAAGVLPLAADTLYYSGRPAAAALVDPL
ncbi:MAG TPA: O-antigen ligase family protein, partial [Candidatus Acidoferrales bacterium]|nr:O-antigen ligase family protein [Candidatus Acidoferrales bacterium]